MQIQSQLSKTYFKKESFLEKQLEQNFKLVKVISSNDNQTQMTYFYKTTFKQPKPLIVSLHIWSESYYDYDTLANLFFLKS